MKNFNQILNVVVCVHKGSSLEGISTYLVEISLILEKMFKKRKGDTRIAVH